MPPRGMMGASAREYEPPALRYNTGLSPADETAFQAWLLRSGRWRDLEDYDLRGFWKSREAFSPNGHGSDRWKKPNHPTFSNESVYNSQGATGGNWVETPDGKHLFFATPDNLRYRDAGMLESYFREAEPDARLVLPQNEIGLLGR